MFATSVNFENGLGALDGAADRESGINAEAHTAGMVCSRLLRVQRKAGGEFFIFQLSILPPLRLGLLSGRVIRKLIVEPACLFIGGIQF